MNRRKVPAVLFIKVVVLHQEARRCKQSGKRDMWAKTSTGSLFTKNPSIHLPKIGRCCAAFIAITRIVQYTDKNE
ncbi:hypothetical protein BAU14_00370 [Enterococcus sp. CU9D]|nr:hypothetical protein BAU14_00370 [Enterococcus sp. CU9D]